MAAIFTKAKNNRFKNTSFTINTTNVNGGAVRFCIRTAQGPVLNRLYDSIAPNAILNAGGRADEVRCCPGTREEVIRTIDKWRLDIQNNVTANQIYWLSGPAGAGKTAIVQTVAENWKSLGIHTANFFFFRTDPSRSHAKSFISTLLYQIFDFCPAAREAVGKVLALKPRILEAGVDEQVDELIFNIFRSIHPPFSQPIVLLIDGLDECESEAKTSQEQIIHVLNRLVGQEDLPFIVLVASRAEPHISAVFRQMTSQALCIFLDEEFMPEADILLFVTAEFEKIKTSHPHAALLRSDWPSFVDIDAIVQKSSGQFIYAATVMRFLAQSSAVPSLSLERAHGIIPYARKSPLVHLDALYTYILQQADDDQAIHDILSFALLYEEPESDTYDSTGDSQYLLPSINEFLRLYDSRYTETLFRSCISDISSVVQLHKGRLKFYHASLSDFLHDQSRSSLFHVDIGAFAAKVLPRVYAHSITAINNYERASLAYLCLDLLPLVRHATPAITHTFLTAHLLDYHTFDLCFPWGNFLQNMTRLYYRHDTKSYKQILKRWITWACDSDQDHFLDRYSEPLAKEWSRLLGQTDRDDRHGTPLLRTYLFSARVQKQISRSIYFFKSSRSSIRGTTECNGDPDTP